jgi:hypothetical protein
MNFRNIPLLLHLTHKTLHLVAANKRIGKGTRCSIIGCRCPPVNSQQSSTQDKSSDKNQDSAEMAEGSTILSTSSGAPNSTDSANAPEQTIDPSDQGTSSAVVPEQTTITSPQGKISIMKSLPMNFYIDTIIIPSICS